MQPFTGGGGGEANLANFAPLSYILLAGILLPTCLNYGHFPRGRRD